VVVAFRMLPELVWNMPPLGTINVHASLLPNYRGAAPINWAIINGETETGVTTFKLQHEIDTGDILLQQKVEIKPEDNIGTLYSKLMAEGAQLLLKTVQGFIDNSLVEQPQIQTSTLRHAPKIFKPDTLIDWSKTTAVINNLVRGMSPIPTAYTILGDKSLKIFTSSVEITKHQDAIGSVHTDQKTFLKFATADGYLHALDLQLEGKKRMLVQDFLRGFKLNN